MPPVAACRTKSVQYGQTVKAMSSKPELAESDDLQGLHPVHVLADAGRQQEPTVDVIWPPRLWVSS